MVLVRRVVMRVTSIQRLATGAGNARNPESHDDTKNQTKFAKVSIVKRILAGALVALALSTPVAMARGGGHGGGHSSSVVATAPSASHVSGTHASTHSLTSAAHQPHAKVSARQGATAHVTKATASKTPRGAVGVARNSHGKIARSVAAKDAFKHSHPCPERWPGEFGQ